MTSFSGLQQVAKGAANIAAKNVIASIVGAIAAISIIYYGFHYITHHAYTVTTKDQVTTLLVSGVHSASEFTTATTDGKATVSIDESAKLLGIPLGKTSLVYEGVARVQAGINLEDLEVKKLNPDQRSIEIALPAPHIQSVNFNVNRSSTLANYRKWFGPKAGPELYEKAQRKAIAEIREEACANDILSVASQNAENQLRTILTKAQFKTIEIKSESVKAGTCPLV